MNTVIYDVFSVYEYSTDRLAWRNTGARGHHIISYQLSGCYEHTVNGRVLTVRENTLFFINKKDSYTVRCIERGSSLCVCFSADTDLETMIQHADGDGRIGNIFKRIMLASALERESNKYLVTARLYELLSLISTRTNALYTPKSREELIRSAHDIIIENYRQKDFNANALAKGCGVGEKQFVKLFRNRYGITPTQFVIELRMNTAARLIEEGYMSISEVADYVGYEDVFYFSRLFKKRFSVSPKGYRMKMMNDE